MKLTRKLDLAVKVAGSIGSPAGTVAALILEADRAIRRHNDKKGA